LPLLAPIVHSRINEMRETKRRPMPAGVRLAAVNDEGEEFRELPYHYEVTVDSGEDDNEVFDTVSDNEEFDTVEDARNDGISTGVNHFSYFFLVFIVFLLEL
ncbi:hypothetical protein PMAYCL1PPCAC_32330, partial [Pristionchus mayeri]